MMAGASLLRILVEVGSSQAWGSAMIFSAGDKTDLNGDDFWFEDPNGDPMEVCWLQGVHLIYCSYNSSWQGKFIQPDQDMFQSGHLCAEFHAGSRAFCGGPVYVSDKIGRYSFDLLRKLVLPDEPSLDGSIAFMRFLSLMGRPCSKFGI